MTKSRRQLTKTTSVTRTQTGMVRTTPGISRIKTYVSQNTHQVYNLSQSLLEEGSISDNESTSAKPLNETEGQPADKVNGDERISLQSLNVRVCVLFPFLLVPFFVSSIEFFFRKVILKRPKRRSEG